MTTTTGQGHRAVRPAAGATVLPRPGRAWTHALVAAIALGAIYVASIWWQDTTASSLGNAAGMVTAAGRVLGMIAAYLLLVLVALMARIPLLEHRVGSDVLTRVHRALGEYTVSLAVCHALLIILGYTLTAHTNPVTETVNLELDYPDVLMATAALGLLIWVGVVSARAVRRRLAYESWYYIHLYVYLAMALAFSHEFANGAEFSTSAHNRMIWVTAHVLVAAMLVYFRIAVPIYRSLKHDVRIAAVVPESKGVVSIHLTGRDLRGLRIQPGQFLRWRFLDRAHWWQSHPYSVSAAPEDRRLRITVKDLGDASGSLRRLRPGTRVWFEGPYGAFTARRLDPTAGGKVLMIAGGVGITPLRALFESLPGGGGSAILLYRASAPAELPLYRELAEIAKERGFGLFPLVGPRHTQPDPFSAAELRRLVPDLAERDVYLCGPPGLVHAARRGLHRAKVPGRRIHVESFDF
ncbi:MAG TPA: ferredoxin reductase family protein [Actinospica sp.]|nr:ferredoxin reductase family protein [Actinospica sp.]